MGKTDLIQPGTNYQGGDRSKWPEEARICELLYLLSIALKNTKVFSSITKKEDLQNFSDDELSVSFNNSEVRDIINRIHYEFDKSSPISLENNKLRYIAEELMDLGTKLDGTIWQTYETIANWMGTSCVLCIKSAISIKSKTSFPGGIYNIIVETFKKLFK